MDRREAILQRLLAIAGDLPGIAEAARNPVELSDLRLPALAVLDGHEAASDGDPQGRPSLAPRFIAMSPQLVLLVQGASAEVGSTLNAFRAAAIAAVQSDEALSGLTLNGDGSSRYQGCATEISGDGRSTAGSMTLDFTINYVLRPAEL